MITLSIVSHRQGPLLGSLLDDIQTYCGHHPLAVELTLNLPERLPFSASSFSFPLRILENTRPRGFAANHNQAFARSQGDFFGVLNPDLRFQADPLAPLCGLLAANPRIGVTAPLVQNEAGETEDSARHFPTPGLILKRILFRKTGLDYPLSAGPFPVDWLAGMFLLFPRSVFSRIKGFDEGYILYCEDIDICARLRLTGFEAYLHPGIAVLHQARRHSHRKLNYLKRHVVSLIRFFRSEVFFALRHHKP
jgi:GT2 family glycosyltransferase